MDYQKLFQQARAAAAKGDYHASRKYYGELWNSPLWRRDKDVQLSYAYACERTGDHTEALHAYRSLIKHYNESVDSNDDTLSRESSARLQEIMREGAAHEAGQIIDRADDEGEALLIAKIFEHGYPRELESGEPLCLKGDQAGHMWLLQEGEIDVMMPNMRPTRLTGTRSRPCLIGELAYFTGMRRSATLSAASKARVIELPYDRIKTLLSKDKGLFEMMEHLFRHRLVLQVLSHHDIFKLFNDIDRRRVTSIFENTLTQAGQTLLEAGEEYPDAFMVQSGTLLLLTGGGNDEKLIGSMHPGDLFHLGGLLRGFKAPYTVICGTPCHLLRLPRHSFEPFMLQRSWLIKAILKHSRLSAERQVLHPEARNLWAADRYFDMKELKE